MAGDRPATAAVLTAVVLGVWYFISYVVLVPRRRFLLRPPHEVVANGFLDWDVFSEILESPVVERQGGVHRARPSSIILGMAVAIAMSQTKLIERAVFPYMVMLQAIPILAISPLIGFWFGYGYNSRVIVVRDHLASSRSSSTRCSGCSPPTASMHDLFTCSGRTAGCGCGS